MGMKLFGSAGSPWTRPILIVLEEKGIRDFERPLKENGWAIGPPQGVNPLLNQPCVPTLLLEDSTALYDCTGIIEYLEAVYPEPPVLPVDVMQRVEVRRWIALAEGLAATEVSPVFNPEHGQQLQDSIGRIFQTMSDLLGERKWCVGDEFTAADAFAGAVLSWHEIRNSDSIWRQRYANLHRHNIVLEKRPSFSLSRYRAH